MSDFEIAIQELASYVEELKHVRNLSDKQILDILDIVQQNYS